MLGWLYHRILRRMETRYAYDAAYLHELVDVSHAAFRRFMKMQMAGRWMGKAPRAAMHAAAIGGALHEDCGPCVQITVDMALEAGVPAAAIEALLRGGMAPDDAQLGFDYGRALLAGGEMLDALRERAIGRWGQQGQIAVSLYVMAGRNFPVLKRAMGHGRTCQLVRVGAEDIAVSPALKAAA